MANWLACIFKGRHQYSVWCEDGEVFLRCMNCGRRSQGWQLRNKPGATPSVVSLARPSSARNAPAVARLSIVSPD